MKLIVAHFSPTGGTKKVADLIAAGFHLPVVQMDLTKEVSSVILDEADIVMAVLPVYIGRVPQIALKRLSALEGNGHKAVAVAVYGNREYEDALLETKDALQANGFQVIAGAAFIAEHSIVRSVAAGRPDAEDEKIAHRFAAQVMEKLQNPTPVAVPGNDPYQELKTSPFHPAADESCIHCGICAEECPVGAIDTDAPEKSIADICINCLRCVQLCPQQCRALPNAFLQGITKMLNEKASAYKNPELFL